MNSSARRLGGCLPPVVVLGVFGFILASFYLLLSLRLPKDAPLARMYRCEADLAFLAKAVDHYHEVHGTYPPAGTEGLAEATRLLSAKANYLPDGPPLDAWDHPYHYVPHTQYDDPQWQALRCGETFCAPGTYQLYSDGGDGDAGMGDAAKQADNICNWDAAKTWRTVYREANKAYMASRGGRS